MDSHKVLSLDLYFFFYINDLPKIINKTSSPIIFADDTSILCAHSNLIDFKWNICIVFTTLNEWLRENKLPLNFNKANYVHFTTNIYMSVNLKIGFNYNFITYRSYTKFLFFLFFFFPQSESTINCFLWANVLALSSMI